MERLPGVFIVLDKNIKAKILKYLEINNINKNFIYSDFYYNENQNILCNTCSNENGEFKLKFNLWLNNVYAINLNNIDIKELTEVRGNLSFGIYVSVGTIQNTKRYSRKHEFGILFLFDENNINKLIYSDPSEDLLCCYCLIQINPDIFQEAQLILD